jgi:hypothetical protein
MTAAYLSGKTPSRTANESQPPALSKTKILIGRIIRIEPLHLYIESESIGPSRTYDILISPTTKFLKLMPWEPGEKEKAINAYSAYIERLNPKAGDPVLPPPPPMKPAPLNPSTLALGTDIGMLSNVAIDPAQPVIAAVIRPLTPDEAKAGRVGMDFPL